MNATTKNEVRLALDKITDLLANELDSDIDVHFHLHRDGSYAVISGTSEEDSALIYPSI